MILFVFLFVEDLSSQTLIRRRVVVQNEFREPHSLNNPIGGLRTNGGAISYTRGLPGTNPFILLSYPSPHIDSLNFPSLNFDIKVRSNDQFYHAPSSPKGYHRIFNSLEDYDGGIRRVNPDFNTYDLVSLTREYTGRNITFYDGETKLYIVKFRNRYEVTSVAQSEIGSFDVSVSQHNQYDPAPSGGFTAPFTYVTPSGQVIQFVRSVMDTIADIVDDTEVFYFYKAHRLSFLSNATKSRGGQRTLSYDASRNTFLQVHESAGNIFVMAFNPNENNGE